MEQTTRSQSVNFLGFLRGQLSGLQGIPTLCYELIQNADDVRDNEGNSGASKIIFDICDDALYVENDGIFRDIDFERMQKVSWGDKREEADTTGAFGIGFISVYQITDSPEIFSSGRHWSFHPEASENKRIIEEQVETQHTRFRLPWAFEISQVRRELGISEIQKSQLDGFAKEMSEVIQVAALFLKQVKHLEVRRSGQSIRRIQTERKNDILLVEDESEAIRWRILEGDFSLEAGDMRKRNGSLIEEKRKSLVTIAVPEAVNDKGLLYAFLPSETRTGLPFHINADFYPSSDRKRILFDVGYKSEWNNIAIQCAATTLAAQIDKVLEIFQPDQFWAMVEHVKRASESDMVSSAFASFWQELKQQIRVKPTVLTVGQKLFPPISVYYPRAKEHAEASNTFEELGLPIVHPSLYRYQNLLTDTQVGVQILKLTNVARALKDAGLTERMELDNLHQPSLRTKDGWSVFLNALNALRESGSQQERSESDALLKKCTIAFGEDGALWPPSSLFQADQSTQEIFSNFSKIIWFSKDNSDGYLPTSLVPRFGLQDGITILEQSQPILPALWQNGKYSPQKMYEWLEGFHSEITSNYVVRESVRELAIWPAAGLLKTIKELYLAGDFEDPLHLAKLIDIEALGGRSEFLETALRVEKLDFITYVRDWIPSVLRANQLSSENRHGLIQVIAEYLGKLQGREDLQQILSELPLVWCGGESFFAAAEVCFDSESIKDVLGPQVHIAFLPLEHTEAVRALYTWLGVAREPRPVDIIERIKDLTSSAPQISNVNAIEKIFAHLATQWSNWSDGTRQKFSPLKTEKWLPGTKNSSTWFEVFDVYSIYQSYLFESQGNFLKIDRVVQQKGSDLIKYLEIKSEPLTEQVVKHLLYVSEQEKPVNQEVYVFLNRYAQDLPIRLLRDKPCLYLKTENGDEKYFRPDQVFWEEHPFGYFRSRLGTEFGRFKDLFDRLEVKNKPDSHDAILVLLEIAEEFGKSNTKLDDRKDVQDIILMSWRLLNTALEKSEITLDEIESKLGSQKTILDARHVLTQPRRLFFDDRPGWGAKFEVVKNNLIPRIEGVWSAMEAAGVQRISKAVTIEIHHCDNQRESVEMKKKLFERTSLIQRVINTYKSKEITEFLSESLVSLSFMQADNIEIVKTFKGFNRTEHANLEKVDAIYLDDMLYFSAENGRYPWIGIARELGYVLYPSGELSSLGMELKTILSQSVEAAGFELDELGYPRVDFVATALVESPEITGLGGIGDHETEFPEEIQIEPENDTEGDSRPPATGGYPKNNGVLPKGKSGAKKPENRKNSRLVSYVSPKDSEPNSESLSSEWSARRNEIGKVGVSRVMEYETAQGRTPTDMELIHVNHPGYDITSIDVSGVPRFIEVKALTGIWDSRSPAQMTKTEFAMAREKGSSYWLYVVEKVETEDFKIYCICDPANQVDAYLFDHIWIQLSEQGSES